MMFSPCPSHRIESEREANIHHCSFCVCLALTRLIRSDRSWYIADFFCNGVTSDFTEALLLMSQRRKVTTDHGLKTLLQDLSGGYQLNQHCVNSFCKGLQLADICL